MNSLSFGCSTGGISFVSGMVMMSFVAGLKRTLMGSERRLPGSARQFCPVRVAPEDFILEAQFQHQQVPHPANQLSHVLGQAETLIDDDGNGLDKPL